MELFYKIRAQASEKLRTPFLYLIVIYAASLTTSIAGMEIFGWVSFLVYFLVYFNKSDWRKLQDLRWQLWAFFALFIHLSLSAALNATNTEELVRIWGESRFLFLFLLWVLVLRRFGLQIAPITVKAIAMFATIGAAYAVLQSYTGIRFPGFLPDERTFNVGGQVLYRGSGFFSNPLTYAHSYGLIFVFLFALWSKKDAFSPKGSLGMILVQGVGVLHSFTRGVWLALAGTMTVMVASLGRKIALTSLVGIIAIAGVLVSVSPVFKARLVSIGDFNSQGFNERLNLWKANVFLANESPLFGVGFSENHRHIPRVFEQLSIEQKFISHAHNNFFEFLGSLGYLGTLILIFAYGTLAYRLFAMRGALAFAALAVLLQMFLSGVVEANFFDGEVSHLFHFLLALGLMIPSTNSQSKVKSKLAVVK